MVEDVGRKRHKKWTFYLLFVCLSPRVTDPVAHRPLPLATGAWSSVIRHCGLPQFLKSSHFYRPLFGPFFNGYLGATASRLSWFFGSFGSSIFQSPTDP